MTSSASSFDQEITAGKRFRFGENWSQFLELMNDDRIAQAERSIVEMVGLERLDGKTFLDIGSGSGLFSLAARRLGASVLSMDFDPNSVACAQRLRDRFFSNDEHWEIKQASVLDRTFMQSLPTFDIVYSWGVLHHTGDMHGAIDNALPHVRDGGFLCLALYRRTWLCPLWKLEKRAYCASPVPVQEAICRLYEATIGVAYRLTHRGIARRRGMDNDRDVRDWLGGYPYESITPRALKALIAKAGFRLRSQNVKSEGIHITPGCDEFVFQRSSAVDASSASCTPNT